MTKPQANDKFYSSKRYKFFPGIAIVHMIDDPVLINQLKAIAQSMHASGCFSHYVFLPEKTYHMTVADLITYKDLQTNGMFSDFPYKHETSLKAIDAYVKRVLGQSKFQLDVRMKPKKITSRKIVLTPASRDDERKLHDFRNKVYKTLHIEPDPRYQFHISLTYRLHALNDKDQVAMDVFLDSINARYLTLLPTVVVKTAELVAFNDMADYRNIELGRHNLGVSEPESSEKHWLE